LQNQFKPLVVVANPKKRLCPCDLTRQRIIKKIKDQGQPKPTVLFYLNVKKAVEIFTAFFEPFKKELLC